MKDRYGTEIVKGDKVIFIHKYYGYKKLNSAGINIGIVDKVTPKTVTINMVNFKGNQIVGDTNYTVRIVSNCYGGNDWDSSDAVMVIDEFPKPAIDYLKNKEN